MATEYIKPDIFFFKDLNKNSSINKNAIDNNNNGINNKMTKNTMDIVDNSNYIYYNPYKQYFKNKVMDRNESVPVYDYEANGGRVPQFFTSNGGFRYITPSLEKSNERY
jgi:hypothetical protein